MEEDKKRKLLIALVIVLFVLLLALVAFFVYKLKTEKTTTPQSTNIASLFLAEESEVDDHADEGDVDGPLVSPFSEDLLQSVPDGIEVEDEEKCGDNERNPHPRLEFKGLLFVHDCSPFLFLMRS